MTAATALVVPRIVGVIWLVGCVTLLAAVVVTLWRTR